MKPEFNLDRAFNAWYYDDKFLEPLNEVANRSEYHMAGIKFRPVAETYDYWMREAHMQGAKAMWEEINYTLASYACAVEGLEPEMVEPCEIFDRARENLHHYIYKQLELFDVPV